jgi:hypothetical protein
MHGAVRKMCSKLLAQYRAKRRGTFFIIIVSACVASCKMRYKCNIFLLIYAQRVED